MTPGAYLMRLRLSFNLTRLGVSQAANPGQNCFSLIERDESTARPHHLAAYSVMTGVPLKDLCDTYFKIMYDCAKSEIDCGRVRWTKPPDRRGPKRKYKKTHPKWKAL